MSPARILLKNILYSRLGEHEQTFGRIEGYYVVLTGTEHGFSLRVDDPRLFDMPTGYGHHGRITLDDGRIVEAVSRGEFFR